MNQGCREKFERDCDTALGWIARFRSDTVTDADRADFALWLDEDLQHGRAMDRMQDLWDDLGSLRHMPAHDMSAHDRPSSSGRRHWLGASFALAASLLLALLFLPRLGDPITPQQYRTDKGERRTVALADGSRITLNTNTRVTVRLGPEQRLLTLQRGEAYFEVAHDKSRPFRVDAGPVQVTAVVTAFNIYRRNESHSDIAVAEGVVRVTERSAPATRAPDTETLHASQRMSASRESFGPSERVSLEPQLAWRRGELLAREMSLAALTAEMERYSDRQIVITDRRVATQTVSGVFQLDHPNSILEALQRSLGLQVVHIDDRTVQLLPAPQ